MFICTSRSARSTTEGLSKKVPALLPYADTHAKASARRQLMEGVDARVGRVVRSAGGWSLGVPTDSSGEAWSDVISSSAFRVYRQQWHHEF